MYSTLSMVSIERSDSNSFRGVLYRKGMVRFDKCESIGIKGEVRVP